VQTGQYGDGAATVRFAKSGVTAQWSRDSGTLLELAEAVGLAPVFGCRSGICGTCATRIISGAVDYIEEPLAPRREGQVLLCCSTPAVPSGTWRRQPRPRTRFVARLDLFMEKPVRVAKWGNSLAVRLPASVVDALELKEGDEVEIHLLDEREFGVSRKLAREELLKRLRAFRGRLPADFRFDRDEANAR
jgi:antitoxin MazE